MLHILESGRVVQVREPLAGPNDATENGNWIDVSNAHAVYIVVNTAESAAANYTLRVLEFDGTTTRAITANARIFHNTNTALNELLTRQADGLNLAITGSSLNKLTVFQVDPARVSAGYDRVTLQVDSTPGNVDATGQVIGAVGYVLPARYKQSR